MFNLSILCGTCDKVAAFPDLPSGTIVIGHAVSMSEGKFLISAALEHVNAPMIGVAADGSHPLEESR